MNVDGVRRQRKSASGDLLTDFAVEFIREQRNDRPCALVVAHKEAHAPYTPPPRFAALFAQSAIT